MAFQQDVDDTKPNISHNPQPFTKNTYNAMKWKYSCYRSFWFKNVIYELAAFRYTSLKLKSEYIDVPPIFVQLLFYKFIDDPFTLPVSSLYI